MAAGTGNLGFNGDTFADLAVSGVEGSYAFTVTTSRMPSSPFMLSIMSTAAFSYASTPGGNYKTVAANWEEIIALWAPVGQVITLYFKGTTAVSLGLVG